jgi:hypothetical protein
VLLGPIRSRRVWTRVHCFASACIAALILFTRTVATVCSSSKVLAGAGQLSNAFQVQRQLSLLSCVQGALSFAQLVRGAAACAGALPHASCVRVMQHQVTCSAC